MTIITHRPRFTIFSWLYALVLAFTITSLQAQQAGSSPVKIFIMVGQSNMLGHGQISPEATPGTLSYVAANDTENEFPFLVDGTTWNVRDDVWITDQNSNRGGLTAGYGAQATKVGPEIGFGHFAGELYGQQVLIVKAAWGGKSLTADFRPPSSGGTTGFYYNQVVTLVNDAIANLGTYFPDYDSGGYEIAGFLWHQGYNDRINETASAEYQVNMANFINDMRSSLSTPNMPFVIATTGMGGGSTLSVVELAQLEMENAATYPAFAGNVKVVNTRTGYEGMTFWRETAQSPKFEGFHWNQNAGTYLNIGLAMGDAMSLIEPPRCPYRLRASADASGVMLDWENGIDVPTSVQIMRDGLELVAAAPGGTTEFLDTTALPGVHNYTLNFIMPGDACDPLILEFDGGISDLVLTRESGQVTLDWTNNMNYAGIKVMRDATVLAASLSGSSITFTDNSPLSAGLVTYSVVPTNGSAAATEAQINYDLSGQLGLLDLGSAGGINPATGAAWVEGDTYRMAFVSSATTIATSSNIETYNDFLQGLAITAGLDGATWRVAGSTATVDARDNTGSNPGTDGLGEAVYLLDGVTLIAGNYTDLWSGLQAPLDRDELGNTGIGGSAFTGSETNGTGVGGIGSRVLGGDNDAIPKVRTGVISSAGNWMKNFNTAATSQLRIFAISEPLQIVSSGDATLPEVQSFDDDVSGGPIFSGDLVTYTVTFSEPMNVATIGTDDFENNGIAVITVNGVSATGDPAIFEVSVTPTSAGSLQLKIAAGATIEDLPGNALNAGTATPDDTIINVTSDMTAPTLLTIVDDVSGGSIFPGDAVTYTVTFSEAMEAAMITTDDFENGSGASVTIDSVSPTGDPAVFEVTVTATDAGTLTLQIAQDAVLEDQFDNALDTTSALPDDTSITVNPTPSISGELGVLDVTANGGINPATGAAWQAGDTYRLAFVTSTTRAADSADIADYNTFVQGVAAGSTEYPLLGNGTWKVMGSTLAVAARDNTDSNPGTDGTGVSVILLDGSTVLATGHSDLWNGTALRETGVFFSVYTDEEGNDIGASSVATGSVSGGTQSTGTNDRVLGGSAETTPKVTTGLTRPNNGTRWMQQFNGNASGSFRYYALSDPLTISSSSGSGFALWIGGFGLAPGDQGFDIDADGDGNDNGVEAFFGTDPSVSSAGISELSKIGNIVTFTHPEADPALADILGSYEWSLNLIDWFNSGVTDSGTTVTIVASPATPAAGTTTVTATITDTVPAKIFVRATASQSVP